MGEALLQNISLKTKNYDYFNNRQNTKQRDC